MDPEPEGSVAVLLPVQHDLVGVGKERGIPVGRREGQEEPVASFMAWPLKSKSSATSRAMVTGA